jgi:FHS family L-fucose permease-like MFS transporter
MTVGCAIGGLLGARVSPRLMMAGCSLAGIALLAAVILVPPDLVTIFGATLPKSMVLMALCGFCTSIMWSSIFSLAVEGLGGRLELASGIFMTMVCGGMLLPLQGLLADRIGILNSYSLTILLFAYLFIYAVALSRPRKQGKRVTEYVASRGENP